jgi:hypothetical protein
VRIRIKKTPNSLEIAEFDRRAFAVGETVEVPARLATLLIVGGYAEPMMERWEAADSDTARRK